MRAVMSKELKINLNSQREILQEGAQKNLDVSNNSSLPTGRIKKEFFLPELKIDSSLDSLQKGFPKVQTVVNKINKYIENIADDYFLLGLHLISLHSLLKESKLATEQIKSWYAENINMPYSSAMQCRKVAEVYELNPELITRYTASGAYLLSTCRTPEEREEIWQEARGEKNAPSIRQLRETLKHVREKKLLEENGPPKLKTGKEDSVGKYRMSPEKIKDSLQAVNAYFERFADCANQEEQLELRQILISSVKQLLKGMREKA